MKPLTHTLAAVLAASSLAMPVLAADTPPPAPVYPTARQLEKLCSDCAFVSNVHTETRKGKGSALGTVGGAVVGGLLGSKIGSGNGRTLATVGGAVAGGAAGNQIEKNANSYTVWVVQVFHRDGNSRIVELSGNDPQLRAGDTVRERDGTLVKV